MLAIAWARADDAIAEGPCPADTGGFAFVLQPAFHKVIANAGGTYIEIDTGADAHYNPTGLLRVHHRDVPPETLSDGVSPAVSYTVPSRPDRPLALGPAWRDRAGAWHALADHAGADLDPAAFTLVRVGRARGVRHRLPRPPARRRDRRRRTRDDHAGPRRVSIASRATSAPCANAGRSWPRTERNRQSSPWRGGPLRWRAAADDSRSTC